MRLPHLLLISLTSALGAASEPPRPTFHEQREAMEQLRGYSRESAVRQPLSEARAQLRQLAVFFERSSHSRYRVELSYFSRKSPVDPPPQLGYFHEVAAVSVEIESGTCIEPLRAAITGLLKLNYAAEGWHGYPFWVWRIRDVYSGYLVSVMIDDENKCIFIGGKWYDVPADLVDSLIRPFLGIAQSVADEAWYRPLKP